MTKHNKQKKHGRFEYEHDWFYHSKAWKQIRLIALDRDNYLCQMCLEKNIISDAVVVHHIEYLDKNFKRALDLNNLMCVCQSCHNKIHANDREEKFKRNIRVAKI